MSMSTTRIRVLELRSVRGTGGGPEKTILNGAALADRDRFEVTVCYIRDRRDEVFALDEWARSLGIAYVEVFEQGSFDISIWRQLREIIRQRGIQLVHAHEYKTDLLALLLARVAGVVPLATAHGWTGHSPRERRLYYPVDKWLLARYPRVVAVSSEIKEQLVRHGATPEKVTVVLNSIDPTAFRRDRTREAGARRALGLADDDIVVGAVGRLEPQKRFDLLIDAFAQVRRVYPRLRLVIAGDGSLKAPLAAHATARGLGDRCLLVGHRTDVTELHHAFDLFVQSSDYEGTPNAVLEAMAMETPLVATDAGGTRELAASGVHGLIVSCGDLQALIAAMTDMLRDPAAARVRAAAARQRIEVELSFLARTRRLESIYESLVQRGVASAHRRQVSSEATRA